MSSKLRAKVSVLFICRLIYQRIMVEGIRFYRLNAEQITANAQRAIESQQQQAMVSLKGEIGTLATALAGKILGAKLEDNDVQSSMIDSMIDDLGAKK